jgi:hypothetical protein
MARGRKRNKNIDIGILETMMSEPNNKTQSWVAINIFKMDPATLSAWLTRNYKKIENKNVRFEKIKKSGPD